MPKIAKISLRFCLTGILTVLIGSAFGSGLQSAGFFAETDSITVSENEDLLFSTPFPALLLSELIFDTGSEIEPKKTNSAAFASGTDLIVSEIGYLKRSKLISISLSVRDLIFPFHTHL